MKELTDCGHYKTPEEDVNQLRVGKDRSGKIYFRLHKDGCTNSYWVDKFPDHEQKMRYTLSQILMSQQKASKLVDFCMKLQVHGDFSARAVLGGAEVPREITDVDTHHLNDKEKAIAKIVLSAFGGDVYTGGCRTFYTTDEWRKRGEEYGLDAELIICHDGGDLSATREHGILGATLAAKLSKQGFYVELCTCWYSAVYKL